MLKKKIKVMWACLSIGVLLAGCGKTGVKLVDEYCDWCGDSPSYAYETSDGSMSYVCPECSSECFFCGEKATRHYENLLGSMVFVCDDCYEDM